MNTRYRADIFAWLFIGGISCLPTLLALCMLGASNHPDTGNAVFLAASALLAVVAYAWLSAFRIELTSDTVTFCSLLQGRHSIRRDGIERVELRKVMRRVGSRTGYSFKLVIIPREGAGDRPLEINAKVFSRKAVDAILALSPKTHKS